MFEKLPADIKASTQKNFSLMALLPKKDGKNWQTSYRYKKEWCTFSIEKTPRRLSNIQRSCRFIKRTKARYKKRNCLGVLLKDHWDGENDLIVVDIDHRKDLVEQAKKGKITSDDIQAKVTQFAFDQDFYIEVSQSGEGLHLIQLGHKHNKKLIRNNSFEYYDSNRWLCLTGNCIHSTQGWKSWCQWWSLWKIRENDVSQRWEERWNVKFT